MSTIKGKTTLENPRLTETVIKMGLYNVLFNLEGTKLAAPSNRDMYNCVVAISDAESEFFSRQCELIPGCSWSIPKNSKEDIMNTIRDIQTGKVPANEQMQVCYRVAIR